MIQGRQLTKCYGTALAVDQLLNDSHLVLSGRLA